MFFSSVPLTARNRRSVVRLAALALPALLCAPVLGAQATSTTHAPNMQEFGVDAGATIGLGDQSSVQITLPAARARVGFFLNDHSRWSIEPAAFLSYAKVKGVDGKFVYDVQLGALYHFRTPTDLRSATGSSVAYVRPFIGESGASGGGSNNEFSAGAGLGIKIPWRPDIAFRFEGNLGYGFTNKAARLGAFAGLSFFTPSLIPIG